jgi:hypothetical protein
MGRAGDIGAKVMTCNYIDRATYVVPSAEVKRYQNSLGMRKGTYEVLACDEVGIAQTRRWIGEQAASRKEASFCMMDDDLRFAVREGKDGIKLRNAERPDVAAMLEWIAGSLGKYAHVSVSARDKNHTNTDAHDVNCRTLRVLAYQTKKFLAMEHGRVAVMEDFDVNLQLLRSGEQNICSFVFASDQRETGSKGGCSSYRTLELHNAAAHRIVELHAPFAKLREKETKAKGVLSKRMEVTIFWKKAFASSQRRAA